MCEANAFEMAATRGHSQQATKDPVLNYWKGLI